MAFVKISTTCFLVSACFHSEMDTKTLLLFWYAFHYILTSFALLENGTVNVLAVVFPPFTTVDINKKFVSGIDVQILKNVAKRLDLQLNWIRTDNIDRILTTESE